MSRTTDHLINLMEATEQISCLHDALKIEVEYDNTNGTPTEIQEYFRELKYEYVMNGLKKFNLDPYVHHFYNFSMQGLVQVFLDNDSNILRKLEASQKSLEDYWQISLKDCIEQRKEDIVVSIQIAESNLTNKK